MGKGYTLALLILLSILLSSVDQCNAAIVWSDDFDDGNLDGWTQSGCTELTLYRIGFVKGNATAADKNLQATGEWVPWAYTYITHPTMTTTGTWSFDVFLPEEGIVIFSCIVDFMDQAYTS